MQKKDYFITGIVAVMLIAISIFGFLPKAKKAEAPTVTPIQTPAKPAKILADLPTTGRTDTISGTQINNNLLGSGLATWLYSNNNTKITSPSTVSNVTVPIYMNVGSSTGATQLVNYITDFGCNLNDYCSTNLFNNNAGTNASVDLTFDNDLNLSSAGTVYSDFGFNSSTAIPGTTAYPALSRPSQAYWYNSEDAISIYAASTTNANAFIDFGTAGVAVANSRMRILANGKIGMGTTSPALNLDVYSASATTTVRIDSSAASKGACLALKNYTGTGYTYVIANNGSLTVSTIACN